MRDPECLVAIGLYGTSIFCLVLTLILYGDNHITAALWSLALSIVSQCLLIYWTIK